MESIQSYFVQCATASAAASGATMASIWSRSNEGREGTEPPLKDSTDAKLSTSEAGFHMGHPVKKKNYSNIEGSTKIQTNFLTRLNFFTLPKL